jgi:hypothetical protein
MVKIPRLYRWLIYLMCWPAAVLADPIFQTSPEAGVKVVLYTEPCKLSSQVTNLPYRATWEENGKVDEGCFGVDDARSLVRLYFADKTVVAAYKQEFVRITGI